MRRQSVAVRQSRIHGKGIFATTYFRKGQKIFTAEGPVIKFAKPHHWRLGPHWINVGKNRWVVTAPWSPLRFTNHSCDPNAILTRGNAVIALQSIRRGEEITIDYSFTESQSTWHMTCKCGEADCRSVIRSIHFLPERLFQRYREYVLPFLQREFARNKVEIVKEGSDFAIFAKRELRKGEPIFAVEGPVIVYKKPPDYRIGHRWLNISLHSWVIPEEENPWSFLRHSCAPNVGLNDSREVIALRAIRRNEELAIDDSITEADPRWRKRCSCGAKNCRGVVRSIQFLPQAAFRKYLPYIPSFLQQVYRSQQHGVVPR